MTAQYVKPDNLKARMAIYDYAVKDLDWQHWLIDQIAPKHGERVLDVGCGTGLLWQKTLTKLPASLSVHLIDRSDGMIAECRQHLPDPRFHFHAGLAENLSCDDNSVDRIIANHMLYHVDDLPSVLVEFRRVLKPDGQLFAATNAKEHLHQLQRLARNIIPDWQPATVTGNFELTSGAAKISAFFADVTVMPFDNILEVTDATAITNYIGSLLEHGTENRSELLSTIQASAENVISQLGAFHIRTAGGLIKARRL